MFNLPPGCKVHQLDHLAKGSQVLRVRTANAVWLVDHLEQGIASGILMQQVIDFPHLVSCAVTIAVAGDPIELATNQVTD